MSVSLAVRDSIVRVNTRVPSADAPTNWTGSAPLPPVDPVETMPKALWLATESGASAPRLAAQASAAPSSRLLSRAAFTA